MIEASQAVCPYCIRTVSMDQGQLADHAAEGGRCIGAERLVAALSTSGVATVMAITYKSIQCKAASGDGTLVGVEFTDTPKGVIGRIVDGGGKLDGRSYLASSREEVTYMIKQDAAAQYESAPATALQMASNAKCPYCTKTVAMTQGVLEYHRAANGPCDGTDRKVTALEKGFAVLAA